MLTDYTTRTDPAFWQCECCAGHLHPKTQGICPKCGTKADEAPDARLVEVEQYRNHQPEHVAAARLRKLAEVVEGKPHMPLGMSRKPEGRILGLDGFNMATYCAVRTDCNTVACLAGHACELWSYAAEQPWTWDETSGMVAIGLSRETGRALFTPVLPYVPRFACPARSLSHVLPSEAAEACRRLADVLTDEEIGPDLLHDEEGLTETLWGEELTA